MSGKAGRPVVWTEDMVDAAVSLICTYGIKHAAAMCGLTHPSFRSTLWRHGVKVGRLRRYARR